MYSLKFIPILNLMIWGGDKLCQYRAIDTDQKNIGESWKLSGMPGNESLVLNGEFEEIGNEGFVIESGKDFRKIRLRYSYASKDMVN